MRLLLRWWLLLLLNRSSRWLYISSTTKDFRHVTGVIHAQTIAIDILSASFSLLIVDSFRKLHTWQNHASNVAAPLWIAGHPLLLGALAGLVGETVGLNVWTGGEGHQRYSLVWCRRGCDRDVHG